MNLNKVGTLAVLPLIAFAVVLYMQNSGGGNDDPDEVDPPTSGILAVAALRDESLWLYDFEDGGSESYLALPGPPHEMATLNGRLYVTLGRTDRLVEIEPSVPAILRIIDLPGHPHGLAVHGGQLLVTLDEANELLTLDPVTLTVVERRPTGNTPHTVAVADDGTVYVTDSRDDRLRAFSGQTLAIPTGFMPESVAVVGDHVVTADHSGGTITIVERHLLAGQGSLVVGHGPVRAVAIDDTHVAVALNADDELVVVDLESLTIDQRLDAPAAPDGLCLDATSSFLAVAANTANVVRVLGAETRGPAVELIVPDGPGACLWLSPAN